MAILSRKLLETRLTELTSRWMSKRTGQAMAYALLSGGKRLRPRLLLAQCREITPLTLDVACALEMIHTYSLIHDDLPALDNDDLRRGHPTVHKAFDEATAILAGDGLLNAAFESILALPMDPKQQVQVLRILADASGIHGMIGGQDSDVFVPLESSESILAMYVSKTGKLLGASMALGAIMDDRTKDAQRLFEVGEELGILFQIQDDVLELTQTTQTLGKSNQSDAFNQKSTYVSLKGMESSQLEIQRLSLHIRESLKKIMDKPDDTLSLIDEILVRDH
jgi:geranylgeranyl diphosphate synthase, type II